MNILPSSISETIEGIFGDDFKSAFKPSTLVPAIVFLLFHLTFLLDSSINQDRSLLVFFLTMATAWQAVIFTLLLFIISSVLRSLEGFILRIATGEAWGNSLILGSVATKLQKYRRTRYFDAYNSDNDDPQKKMQDQHLKWELFNRFPVEEGYLAPTALGNTIAATQSYLWQRYRIDMSALLPILDSTLQDTNSFKIKIDSHKSNMTFLLNMGVLLVLFAVEHLIINLIWVDLGWKVILIPGLLVIIAYLLMYRSAVMQAQSWGQVVKQAFIVHQETVLEKFGVEKGMSSMKKREAFYKIGQWLAWAHREKYEGVFKENQGLLSDQTEKLIPYNTYWPKGDSFISANPSISCTSSVNVTANVRRTISTYENFGTIAKGVKIAKYLMMLDYKFPQDGQKELHHADGVYVVVSDPHVPTCKNSELVPTEIKGISKPMGKRIPRKSGSGYAHYWYIDRLGINSAGSFEYQIEIEDETFRIEILNDNDLNFLQIEEDSQPFDEKRQTYRISVKNNSDADKGLKLQVTDKRFSEYKQKVVTCFYWIASSTGMEEEYCKSDAALSGNRLTWTFPANCLPAGRALDLDFRLVKK
jgi:hypothetical protein